MHDAEGAQNNGIACIGVTFGFGGRDELACAGVDQIVDTMEELRELLLK